MIFFFYSLVFIFLSIFSYSQTDLNLNLSKNSSWLFFENQMKNLGYFNRPLSFWIFVFLSLILVFLYTVVLYKIHNRQSLILNYKFLIPIVISYFFAYPAFLSYDVFNYFFDAKIVTKYYQNPYFHSALEYRFDTWLRFMRWTHRTYPYGPLWLLATIIPIFLGFDKLILTIFTFKIFNLIIFLGCLKMMQLILKKMKKPISWMWAFVLNPITIYDFLISMHNESLMLFFLLASFYYLIQNEKKFIKKYFLPVFFLFLSVSVKYVTIIFLPAYIWFLFSKKSNEEKNNAIINFSPLISLISLIPLIIYKEAYSWYFTLPVALYILNLSKKTSAVLVFLSLLVFRYSPFILNGEYNRTVVAWQNWISWGILGAIGAFLIFRYSGKTLSKTK